MKFLLIAKPVPRLRLVQVTLSALVMLTACSSLAPHYTPPTLPVATQYPATAEQKSADADSSSALPEWQVYFRDPQLQRLIHQALDQNRDLRLALARVAEARAAYGIQRAEQLPNLGAQAGFDRTRVPADLNLTRRPLVGSQYQVGLGVNEWEIDFWGRLHDLNQAALETYLASDEARRAVSLALVAQVADAYFTLAELNERIVLAQRTLDSRAESYRIFSRRVAVGSTSRFNLIQIETLLNQAQALSAQLTQGRDASLHALTLLLGSEIDGASAKIMQSDTASLPALNAGLPSDLLIRHPNIIAAEHRLKAANANIGAARAAFFPRIALTGSLGTASAELDGLFAGGSKAWVFSSSITLPIFEGGRLQNNLSLAQVRRDSAVANYEKTVQSTFREVSDALSARYWLTQQLGIAETTLAAQKERARLSQLRYDNGASAFLDVLDAQRDLLSAEQQLVQIRRALQSNGVGLYAALGGAISNFSDAPLEPSIATGTKQAAPSYQTESTR